MLLVEVILGEKTGDRALATALDYVRAIKKTPIVVHDSRGFYANRCVGNYIHEGHIMLLEGVPPAMIENVAKMAGMPVGPLALNDEVGLDLALKIIEATKRDLGSGGDRSRAGEFAQSDGHRPRPAWAQERQGFLRLSRARVQRPCGRVLTHFNERSLIRTGSTSASSSSGSS